MTCLYCSKEITLKVRIGRKYCSDKCRANHFYHMNRSPNKDSMKRIKKCRYCDLPFETLKPNQVICSARCRITANRLSVERHKRNVKILNELRLVA